MHRDEDQIVISYPNEEVCKERVVIRQKYKNVPIPNHRHEYIELSFMMEGELSMQIEGKEIRMKSGDICLMNRNVSHSSERATDGIWMFNILMTADQKVFMRGSHLELLPGIFVRNIVCLFCKREIGDTKIQKSNGLLAKVV